MALRNAAIQAWEQSSQNALVISARQALTAVLGETASGLLTLHEVSQLDGASLVVFTDGTDHVAAHKVGADDWRVLTVADDDGWVKRGGPFASLAELGEWFAHNPPAGGVQPWQPGEQVAVGDQREYDGVVYVCIQAHSTQGGWEPPNTPALWSPA